VLLLEVKGDLLALAEGTPPWARMENTHDEASGCFIRRGLAQLHIIMMLGEMENIEPQIIKKINICK
jgi:hypothetical protein